jgi:hypothetical protein
VYAESSKCIPHFEEFSIVDLNVCDVDYIYHDGIYYISEDIIKEQKDEN